MSLAALQRLDFIVGLIDQVSGPAGKMMKTMDTVTSSIQTGYQKIGYGAAGVAGAGFALDRLIAPTKELDNALRTVESLDVVDSVLTDLTKTSLKFSTTYGGAASDFVGASYDIQSAISGLVGNELGQFTNASAILAKGTKANVATITNYVGTMYGIFKNSADEMGKGEWVEMLSGQTAAAVQIFKTTGSSMSSAFTSTGAAATAHGIAMNEQIAILGTLQATMSGSEAGTKYKAFLDGVGKAQDTLGLKFTDSNDKMLPMVQIMDLIRGKFGDLDTVAESDLLKKAFGTKEAVDLIKLLSTDVDGLNKNIGLIGQQKGMDKAIQMAKAMTDPWEVAGAQVESIQTVIGKALMPTLLPWLSAMGDGAQTVLRWTELFPNLTRVVGLGVLSIIGLIAGFSALSIIVGISKFVMAGWTVAATVMKLAMIPFGPVLVGLKAGWVAMNLSIVAGNGIMATAKAGMLATWGTMKFLALQSKLATAAVWIFNGGLWGMTTALFANPITWVVLGITALIAVVAAAVVYWDVWTGKLVEWTSKWWEFIGLFSLVDGVLAAWDKLPEWWSGFKNWLGTLDPFSFVGDSLDWLISKVNLIPGISIGNVPDAPKPVSGPASLQSDSGRSPAGGGLVQQISNANANNSRSIGDINVYNSGNAMDGQTFMNELAFAAG